MLQGRDDMNITDYLINPMGRGSAVLSLPARRKELDEQYKILYSRIKLTWYLLGDKFYIAHLKIPSRRHEQLYYDVLIQFDIESIPQNTNTINNCNLQVFSNCPSFTYTYAYVFNKNKDLIEWSRRKYPTEVILQKPSQRNPYQILSYERSLYFAFRYLTSNGRNYIEQIKSSSIKITGYNRILTMVQSADRIKELNGQLTAKKENKKIIKKNNTKKNNSQKKPNNSSKRIQPTKVIKTTNKVSTTKKTKKTKKL